MRTCPKCGTSKPMDAFRKNKARKSGTSVYCRHCEAEYMARFRQRHRERLKAWHAAHYKANREAIRARNNAWAVANPDKRARISSEWTKANAARVLAKCARRRARKLMATPAWADLGQIEAMYAEARRVTEESGVKHEVDHIIPLKGDTATGLHVQFNLQIIPMTENRRKWKHMPGVAC